MTKKDLITVLKECREFIGHNAQKPSHAGPCGFESNCDDNCMDAARDSELY